MYKKLTLIFKKFKKKCICLSYFFLFLLFSLEKFNAGKARGYDNCDLNDPFGIEYRDNIQLFDLYLRQNFLEPLQQGYDYGESADLQKLEFARVYANDFYFKSFAISGEVFNEFLNANTSAGYPGGLGEGPDWSAVFMYSFLPLYPEKSHKKRISFDFFLELNLNLYRLDYVLYGRNQRIEFSYNRFFESFFSDLAFYTSKSFFVFDCGAESIAYYKHNFGLILQQGINKFVDEHELCDDDKDRFLRLQVYCKILDGKKK